MSGEIFIDNSGIMRATNIKGPDGSLLSGASISMTIYETDEQTEVAGAGWPISFSENSPGDYSASVPDTLVLTENVNYMAIVSVQSGANKGKFWERLHAVKRYS